MFNRTKIVYAIIFFGLLSFSVSFAQEAVPNVPVIEVNQDAEEEGYVSLDFREADIKNVLEVLALKSGVNIVVSPKVTGTISVKLDNVEWHQALDVILQTHGYASQKSNNIILVTTVDSLKQIREDAMLLAEQETLKTETFILSFSKASEIVSSIEKMKSDRGSVNTDERTNTIIITDISEKIDLIGKVIKKLDSTTPQVLIESKIVETILGDNERLGINWDVTGTASGASRNIIYPFHTSSNNPFAPGTLDVSTAGYTAGVLNFTNFQAVLEMLNTRTDTNIISNPKIVALNNVEAKISVGREIRVVTGSTTDVNGNVTVERKPIYIGISLKVKAQVNNANFVTLDVNPEVSEAIIMEVDGEEQTIKDTKGAQTQVIIKSQDTLVIGGLIKSKEVDAKDKVPLLGDIPVLGLLFRHSRKEIEKTDLLIFITPSIVTPEFGK
ncbi:MAG: secretin N-terminal domain-containing protein [Candidatus Zapsychrus exili]|nr:secretin N-terminal domain-containing protein [Candidatus Zapsychrus exili]